MSTETITIIVSALALAVTIVGAMCAVGAWGLARVDRRFDGVRRELTEFAALVDKRFDAIDRRFALVDERFDAVDRRFEAVNRRFEAVDERFETLESSLRAEIAGVESRLRAEIAAVDRRVGEVAIAVARLEGPLPRLHLPRA